MYNGMLFSNRNKWVTDTLKTDKYQNYYGAWKKSRKKRVHIVESNLGNIPEKTNL